MSGTYTALFALAVGAAAVLPTTGAAQSAADINRLNQAMAVCASPAGALLTECQQLKGVAALGGIPGVQGVAGAGASSPQATAAAQQVYAACVRAAGLNQAALAQCNANLNRAMGLPQPQAGPYTQYDRNTNTAMNIHAGGQRYQQCVAALMAQGGQPGGINPCTPLLNGAPAGPGAPAGFGPAQAYNPNPPAPTFTPQAPGSAPVDPLAPAGRPFDPLGL